MGLPLHSPGEPLVQELGEGHRRPLVPASADLGQELASICLACFMAAQPLRQDVPSCEAPIGPLSWCDVEPEVGFEPTTFRLRVGEPSSSRCFRVLFWLLTSAGSSVECVSDLSCYGRGNDQENDQADPWRLSQASRRASLPSWDRPGPDPGPVRRDRLRLDRGATLPHLLPGGPAGAAAGRRPPRGAGQRQPRPGGPPGAGRGSGRPAHRHLEALVSNVRAKRPPSSRLELLDRNKETSDTLIAQLQPWRTPSSTCSPAAMPRPARPAPKS
jgi:hypothetical protein